MDYVLHPLLEDIDHIKVAITLWSLNDIKDFMGDFSIPSNYKEFKSKWVKIEAMVVKKVAKLPQSKQSKEKILSFIRPVGLQISKWKQFHDKGCNLKVDIPNEFCWTLQGTIDKKETAKLMFKDESMDIATRFKFACFYCLEDDIPKLWNKIPEDSRKSFYSQVDPMYVMQNELVIFWTYQIKEEVYKLNSMIEKKVGHRCSPYQYAFELAASDGNRVATEYFLQKLTSVEREESLVKTAKSVAFGRLDVLNERTGFLRETYSEVLCFLLSQLDKEQQLEIFKSHPDQVLTCFLDWPLQTFFMETANHMWDFFSKQGYGYFLLRITGKMIDGYKDFNYQKLFGEFWQQSPNDHKRHVLSGGIIRYIVLDLFKIRDEKNIKLFFEAATLEEKKNLIYDDMAQDICKNLMNGKNQLNLLKFFVKECLPSKIEVIEFKNTYEEGMLWTGKFKNEFKFIRVLNEVICEFKKRKCEEGGSNKAKKV